MEEQWAPCPPGLAHLPLCSPFQKLEASHLQSAPHTAVPGQEDPSPEPARTAPPPRGSGTSPSFFVFSQNEFISSVLIFTARLQCARRQGRGTLCLISRFISSLC